MDVQCTVDGIPMPGVDGTVTLDPPYREWHIAGFEIRRSRRVGRWTVQTGAASGRRMCGAAAYRTPLGAFLAVLRMLREG